MKKLLLGFILLLSIILYSGCTGNKPNLPNNPEFTEYKVDVFYDEKVQSTTYVKENEYFSRPNSPTKDGFVFDNWYVDYFFTELFDFNKPINSNLTVYGRFLKEIVISFENTNIDDQIILEGNLVNQPEIPNKQGYIFDGWYVDSNFTTLFDFNTIVSSDLTIYAKFIPLNKYTVTFNSNGGSTVSSISVEENKVATQPANPTKDGFIFGGWYKDAACTTAWDFNNDKVTADITLYAKWTERSQDVTYFTVTFNSMGGSAVSSLELEQYDKITAPDTPTKDGYTFDGWYFDEACTRYCNFAIYEVEENITLFAKWLENIKYTVTFDSNGGSSITSIEVEENGLLTKPTNPTKEGFTFDGWYTDSACTIVWDFENNLITENVTLYAKWSEEVIEIINYTITFDSNGGSSVASIEVEENGLLTKPTNPTKEGYRFDNWYLDIDDDLIFDFSTPINENLTLKANWIKLCTISFISEYGVFEDIIVDINSPMPVLPNPIYSGQIFKGWYIESNKVEENSLVDDDLILTAKWEAYNQGDDSINIIYYSGYYEALYIEINFVTGYNSISDYEFYYKLTSEQNYIEVDAELIRSYPSYVRCDILGLSAGTYDVLIKVGEKQRTITNINVIKYDRSGYAHFNYNNGVGAYNDDGTIKDGALIVYVTEENKNTVTLTVDGKTYTGISNILKNQSKYDAPLIVRIIGKINAATWNSITYSKGSSNLTANQILDQNGNALPAESMTEDEIISGGYNSMSDDINNGITKLNGLTNKISYSSGEFDSYYNMLDISGAKNVTVEGVGTDAILYQWGFTWSNCSYIEVRNLTFDDYTEDACSFQGAEESTTISGFSTGHIWIHHNTFNRGKNNWDVCPEQDKLSGDGATDLKRNAFITISYNHYNACKKTGLVGGGDTQKTACVSFHHNYYNQNGSRLPLGRQANMHMYNNYYYKSSGTNMSIRAGAYAFIENCVFENCSNAIEIKTGNSKTGAVKLYNNTFNSCSGISSSVVYATSRTQVISNDNIYSQNFDTNSSVFYFDDTNKVSDVTFMLDLEDVASYCKNYSGVLKENFTPYIYDNNDNPNDEEDDSENQTPITSSTVLTLNDFSTQTITSSTTIGNITIYPKTNKTATIKSCDKTIAGTSISRYISFGGGSSVVGELCIEFSTTKQANITIYYASAASGRYISLYNDNYSQIATTGTTGSSSTIVNYTFSNVDSGTYCVASSNSSIDIYCIVIEYLE